MLKCEFLESLDIKESEIFRVLICFRLMSLWDEDHQEDSQNYGRNMLKGHFLLLSRNVNFWTGIVHCRFIIDQPTIKGILAAPLPKLPPPVIRG